MIEAEEARAANEAWALCRRIAEHPRILETFAEAYRAAGAVGEERNAKLLYLALTSRFLQRPVSVVVKGPSSGGKSFSVETVLRFFPPEAVYCVTAISDRALAYTEAELKHRFLVIFEAAGMMGEFASYLIRSLLSEGRLVYEVVESLPSGLVPTPHRKGGADRAHRDHHRGAAASGERDPAPVAARHRHPGADPGRHAGARQPDAAHLRFGAVDRAPAVDRTIRTSGGRFPSPWRWQSAFRRSRCAFGGTSLKC